MNYNIMIILVMNIINSFQNVIRECNVTQINGTTNGTNVIVNGNQTTGAADVQCPSFSQLICPTKCDPSCKRPLIKRSMCQQPIACPKKDCICSPDYVRNGEHKCIPRERCSENCPTDEIYKLCPSSCEVHCGNVNHPPNNCAEDEREDHECIAECVCPSALIRDYSTGSCVHKESCSQKSSMSCPMNEEYRNCSLVCDRVCNKDNPNCNPKDNCKSGCFCKIGFIRQNINAKCIAEDFCFTVLKDTESV